jgi:hypothetical protein
MGRPKKPLNNPCQVNFKTEERLRNIARIAHLTDADLWELGLKTQLGVQTLHSDEIIKHLIKCEQIKIHDSEERITMLVEQLKRMVK